MDEQEIKIPESSNMESDPVIPEINTNTTSVQFDNVEQTEEINKEDINTKGKSFITKDINLGGGINKDDDIISLPSTTTKKIMEILKGLPDMSDKKDADFAKWAEVISESLEFINNNDVGIGSLTRKGSAFKQNFQCDGDTVGPRESRVTDRTGSIIKDEVAKSRLGNYLKLSTKFQAPMYHSGFWLTFKSPTELEMIQLITDIGNIKVSYGRDMRGMIYSSSMIAIVDKVVEFAIDHIYSSTINSFDGDYRNIIDYRDINLLLWGVATTMFPRGFQYRRACMHDPEKCNHVVEERLNLQTLIRLDDNIPEHAKRHMINRSNNEKTLESIKSYSSVMNIPKAFIVTAENGNRIKFTLKSPTVKEYIDDGYKWINYITTTIENSISEDADKDERESVIQSAAKSTLLRTYGHFIKTIELVDEDNVIEDKDTIEDALEMLSSDSSIREGLLREITDYIDTTMYAMISIPNYDCPNCGESQQVYTEGRWVEDIPLEVLSLFFSLLFQKVSKITNRDM